MVVTRGQASRLKQGQPEQDSVKASPVSGVASSSVLEEGERQLVIDKPIVSPVLDQQGSRVETGEDSMPLVSAGMELPVRGDDWLLGGFCFDEDVFIGGKESESPSKSRSEKRKDHHKYTRVQTSNTGDLEVDISKQEFRKLQDDDSSIQTLCKVRPDRVVEQDGLWYHMWSPRQQREKTVEQLLLPMPYCKIVCKLAHTVPLAGHLGKDKTADRITRQFYWPTLFHDVAGVQSARKLPEEINIECL